MIIAVYEIVADINDRYPTAKVSSRTVWSNGRTVRNYCGQDRPDGGNYSTKHEATSGYRKMTMILIDEGATE